MNIFQQAIYYTIDKCRTCPVKLVCGTLVAKMYTSKKNEQKISQRKSQKFENYFLVPFKQPKNHGTNDSGASRCI